MTGKEFREWRKIAGLKDAVMFKMFHFNSKEAYLYHESRGGGNIRVPPLFECFFNYSCRYGLKKACDEFRERFKK